MSDKKSSRRSFLKISASSILAATPLLQIGKVEAKAKNWIPSGEMKYRMMGDRTKVKVSEIGIGGYAINDPAVIHYAQERGVNYIDTAWDYRRGASEIAIGKALKGRRDKFVLTTKWHPWSGTSKRAMMEMLNQSLKRLQTDYVDFLLVHQVGKASGGESLERLKNPALYEAYEEAKKQGKVRFTGVSGHDGDLMEVMNWVVDTKKFDMILMRYNFMQYKEQEALIKKAKKAGMGITAMKTLSGAKGEKDTRLYRKSGASMKQAALKWVLSNPDISNLIITIVNKKQVDEYAKAAGSELAAEDREILKYYAKAYGDQVCTMCNECESSCPYNLQIANILRYYMYSDNYGLKEQGQLAYAAIPAAFRADQCLNCDAPCEQSCDAGVKVKREMTKAHESLNIG